MLTLNFLAFESALILGLAVAPLGSHVIYLYFLQAYTLSEWRVVNQEERNRLNYCLTVVPTTRY